MSSQFCFAELFAFQPYGEPFVGCVKDVSVRGQSPGPPATYDTRACAADLEPGNFFHDQGGYLRLSECFTFPSGDKVVFHCCFIPCLSVTRSCKYFFPDQGVIIGTLLDVSLIVRPRSTSGVLFVTTAEDHHILLQLNRGQVQQSVRWQRRKQNNFCRCVSSDLHCFFFRLNFWPRMGKLRKRKQSMCPADSQSFVTEILTKSEVSHTGVVHECEKHAWSFCSRQVQLWSALCVAVKDNNELTLHIDGALVPGTPTRDADALSATPISDINIGGLPQGTPV